MNSKHLSIVSIVGVVVTSLLLGSCKRDEPQLIDEVQISFEMPDTINNLPLLETKAYASQKVKLKGSIYEYTATTDSNGKAAFLNVFPDKYNVSTSWELSDNEYNYLTGSDIQLELGTLMLLSGNKADLRIFNKDKITEKVSFALIKSLIISKVYYTMSKTKENKNYMVDSYIELYNNSSSPISLDNLHVGLTESGSPPAFLSKNNQKDVYLRQAIRIPNGLEIGSYQSYVIACRSALDHTEKAEHSVDLSKANLEVKDYDNEGNPSVTAARVLFNSSGKLKFFNLQNNGGNGVVIFKTTDDIDKWEKLPPPDKPNNVQRFLKVDNKIIMDGVETLVYKTSGIDVELKRLNKSIDATYTYNTGGTYSNEACERKVKETIEIDGKVCYILMDTNNSFTDFAVTKTNIRTRVYDKRELMP